MEADEITMLSYQCLRDIGQLVDELMIVHHSVWLFGFDSREAYRSFVERYTDGTV